MGDFNAHNRMWNCEMIDANGEKLAEEMEEMNMFLVNGDTKSRMGESNVKPGLDVCFERITRCNKI